MRVTRHGRAFCGFGYRSPESLDFELPTLADFQGVRRRQDVLYSDDSGRSSKTLRIIPQRLQARSRHSCCLPDRKMTVCFEPRSNTAASARFQTEFQSALSAADRVYLERSIGQIVCVQRNDWIQLGWRMRSARRGFADNQSLLEALKMCVSDEAHGLIVF